MRPVGKSADAETVSRRLELLSAELRSTLPAPDEHTHIRPGGPADPWQPTAAQPAPEQPSPEQPSPEQAAPEVPAPGRHAARRRGRPGGGVVDLSALHGRIGLGPAHVAVLAVLVAVGLGVTTWWVLRDDPGDTPLGATAAGPLATPVPTGAAEAGPSGSAATGGHGAEQPGAEQPGAEQQGADDLVVDVTGKVRRPGIVVLDPGSRVVDALEAAGGAKPGVNLIRLNLARPLTDGEQIVVGIKPPPGTAATTAPRSGEGSGGGAGELVNINTASQAELEELSGVGPVTAEAIIEWRTTNGGFQSVDQLLDVDGIGEKTLADLSPHVTIG